MPPERFDRDRTSLLDIRIAAGRILQFVSGLDREAFREDLKTRSAVLHQLLVIGEATKRLSDGFRRAHPAIPWAAMAGMRDRLIHEYDEVDLEEVWRTASLDVPQLLEDVSALIPRDEGEQA